TPLSPWLSYILIICLNCGIASGWPDKYLISSVCQFQVLLQTTSPSTESNVYSKHNAIRNLARTQNRLCHLHRYTTVSDSCRQSHHKPCASPGRRYTIHKPHGRYRRK
ncbi:hypothetical protein DFH94DRAFT_773150, partial [Russula ochroleuca]